MTPTEADGGSAPTDSELQIFTDDQRRSDAARARRREHWLRQQADEDGTFTGVLVDLAEQRRLLVAQTKAGRTLRGTVRTIGADFVELRTVTGDTTYLALGAVMSLRPEPGTVDTSGDRAVVLAATLDVAISELAADRPRVSLHTLGGEHHAGLLWTVGRDLLTVRTNDGVATYVPLTALNDLLLA
ncbi:MAG: hypothetical protein ABIP03_13985 [Aquihabitans sp.]